MSDRPDPVHNAAIRAVMSMRAHTAEEAASPPAVSAR
jgi:hypothetical protein